MFVMQLRRGAVGKSRRLTVHEVWHVTLALSSWRFRILLEALHYW